MSCVAVLSLFSTAPGTSVCPGVETGTCRHSSPPLTLSGVAMRLAWQVVVRRSRTLSVRGLKSCRRNPGINIFRVGLSWWVGGQCRGPRALIPFLSGGDGAQPPLPTNAASTSSQCPLGRLPAQAPWPHPRPRPSTSTARRCPSPPLLTPRDRRTRRRPGPRPPRRPRRARLTRRRGRHYARPRPCPGTAAPGPRRSTHIGPPPNWRATRTRGRAPPATASETCRVLWPCQCPACHGCTRPFQTVAPVMGACSRSPRLPSRRPHMGASRCRVTGRGGRRCPAPSPTSRTPRLARSRTGTRSRTPSSAGPR